MQIASLDNARSDFEKHLSENLVKVDLEKLHCSEKLKKLVVNYIYMVLKDALDSKNLFDTSFMLLWEYLVRYIVMLSSCCASSNFSVPN